jgi:Protein kinase domain/Anaphase-promoting complex subunit 4 WD40 domain/WD domain, G-beta repeat
VSAEVPEAAGGLLPGLGPGSRVAGYRLEEHIGAGGMAVVFRAVDERLGRQVALKVMAPALAADPGFRERFIREARAAAAVDDPHIIPVHEAGEAGGALFIAMRYVPGGDVRSLLRQVGPLDPSRAAAIIAAVASALDAAHAAGLVHRDVKPANMLVDVRPGRPDHVYLSDFGLSKGVLSSAGLTRSGHFLGTPNYTAPEQIQGGPVDGRADQYALACAAFELLTGEAPFQRDDAMAVIWAHLQQPPPSLSARRPGLPEHADPVLGRALAKVPEKRYASCLEFAGELRDALGAAAYEPAPVTAVPEGRTPTEIVSNPGRTPPGPAGSETVTGKYSDALVRRDFAVTVTGAVRGPELGAKQASVPGPAGNASRPQRAGFRRIHRNPRAVVIVACVVAVMAIVAVMITQNLSHRQRTAASAGQAHPHTTSASGQPHPRTVTTPADVPTTAPVSTHIPTTATLEATVTDPGSRASVLSVALSPDARTLATGDLYGGRTSLWDVATGQRIITVTEPGSQGVAAVAFSPDGRTLATGDLSGGIYLWNVATGQHIATLTDSNQQVDAVAFSPDGTILATGDGYSTVYLWRVTTRRRIAALTDPASQSQIVKVAFSPDGRTLATGDNDGSTYLWDVATRQRIATLTDPSSKGVAAVAFSPDGRIVATGDYNGGTYLWSVATGQRTATITRPGAIVWAVAFSPDLRLLAINDAHDLLHLWLVGTRKIFATVADPDTSPLQVVAFSRDDRTMVAGDATGHLWKLS